MNIANSEYNNVFLAEVYLMCIPSQYDQQQCFIPLTVLLSFFQSLFYFPQNSKCGQKLLCIYSGRRYISILIICQFWHTTVLSRLEKRTPHTQCLEVAWCADSVTKVPQKRIQAEFLQVKLNSNLIMEDYSSIIHFPQYMHVFSY